MSTNIQITTGEDCAVLYFQDGTTMTVGSNVTQSVQLVETGFVTISEAADPDAAEHPDQHPGEAFIQAMIDFWEEMLAKIEDAKEPEVNPL